MRSFSRFTALTRRVVAATLILAVTAVAAAAQAGHGPQNVDDNGVILKGFDAVAFPAQNAPVQGSPSFTATHDGDPAALSVVDGKLYLNMNPEVRSMWARDIPGNERKAQRNWMQVAAARGFDRM